MLVVKCKVATSGAATDSEREFWEASTPKLPHAIPEIIVAPMGNMPVIKDLVVDMSSFWNHLEAVVTLVLVRDKSQNESFTNT